MSRYSPTVLPGYYGPEPDDLAQILERGRQRKRQDASDKREQARFERQQRMDPLEEALYRANLHAKGITGPGLGGDDEEDTTPGEGGIGRPRTPPAAPRAQESAPSFDKGGGDRMPGQGFDAMPQRPAIQGRGPSTAVPVPPNPIGAAALPGAFNPVTGAHNDVDIGAGFRMAYSATPEGQRATRQASLAQAGIPGMTPELASYLADNPDHAATIIDQLLTNQGKAGSERYPHTREEVRENESFLSGLRGREKTERLPTLAEAFRIVDENYKGVSGGSLLNPSARARMAQQIAAGKLDPANLPNVPGQGSGTSAKGVQYETVGKRHGFQVPDRTKGEQELDAAGQRRTQLAGVSAIVEQARAAHRTDQEITTVLQKHGLSDDEIEQVLHPKRTTGSQASGRF